MVNSQLGIGQGVLSLGKVLVVTYVWIVMSDNFTLGGIISVEAKSPLSSGSDHV